MDKDKYFQASLSSDKIASLMSEVIRDRRAKLYGLFSSNGLYMRLDDSAIDDCGIHELLHKLRIYVDDETLLGDIEAIIDDLSSLPKGIAKNDNAKETQVERINAVTADIIARLEALL